MWPNLPAWHKREFAAAGRASNGANRPASKRRADLARLGASARPLSISPGAVEGAVTPLPRRLRLERRELGVAAQASSRPSGWCGRPARSPASRRCAHRARCGGFRCRAPAARRSSTWRCPGRISSDLVVGPQVAPHIVVLVDREVIGLHRRSDPAAGRWSSPASWCRSGVRVPPQELPTQSTSAFLSVPIRRGPCCHGSGVPNDRSSNLS